MNLQNNKKIVTVAVITYYSAATVLDTLDSIVNQTYGAKNIELIISDDCSKDNTVQVIELWLKQHQDSFNSVKFFVNKVNEGISKNCNVVWKAATSEWVKSIAGDDLLTTNALDDLITFTYKNENVNCIFGLVKRFPVDDVNLYPVENSFSFNFFKLEANKQFEVLLIGNVPHAPASFIKKNALMEVGYADEEFRLLEDYPLWLKLTKYGYKLHLMDRLVVNYRVSESVSLSLKNAINFKLNNEVRRCLIKYSSSTYFLKKSLIFIDTKQSLLNDLIVLYFFKNKKSIFTRFIKVITPLGLLRRLRLFL